MVRSKNLLKLVFLITGFKQPLQTVSASEYQGALALGLDFYYVEEKCQKAHLFTMSSWELSTKCR